MFIFAYDKDSFEDQLKASEPFWKCPPIENLIVEGKISPQHPPRDTSPLL